MPAGAADRSIANADAFVYKVTARSQPLDGRVKPTRRLTSQPLRRRHMSYSGLSVKSDAERDAGWNHLRFFDRFAPPKVVYRNGKVVKPQLSTLMINDLRRNATEMPQFDVQVLPIYASPKGAAERIAQEMEATMVASLRQLELFGYGANAQPGGRVAESGQWKFDVFVTWLTELRDFLVRLDTRPSFLQVGAIGRLPLDLAVRALL